MPPAPAERPAGSVSGPELPSPALVLLVGPSGAGKTTWAKRRYAWNEIVSSDALRAVVGSGESDLEASSDAFAVLDAIIAARLRRGLTTVVDTLGLDPIRRASAIALGRSAQVPVVGVRFTTALAVCRGRNRLRDRPVPAAALRSQFQRTATLDLTTEDFEAVFDVDTAETDTSGIGPSEFGTSEIGTTQIDPAQVDAGPTTTAEPDLQPNRSQSPGLKFALQISAFPWEGNPRQWLGEVTRTAEQAGFDGIAVMDHLLQIPQVGRAWDPIPEAYVTLGYLAGVTERVELGALVSPVTFRSAPLLAKILASLDTVSGGRAFCGLGAGWFEREHAGYALAFPSTRQRLNTLESTIGTLRAFWGPGTKPFGELPETTCYPRPGAIPIIVGGGGERRTLNIAARLADGCNISSALPVLEHKLEILRAHAARAGRSLDGFRVTVLDLPIVGDGPDEVARLVEAHRGRSSAKAYAVAHHASTVEQQIDRYRMLADRGVHTVFVSLPNLKGPEQVARFGRIIQTFRV